MTIPNVFPHQPEFADNRDENTLAAALIARIEHLCATLATAPDLDVATGYFNPEGFGILACEGRGFQPWRPPKPLPPIQADDVNVVVWMAVTPE